MTVNLQPLLVKNSKPIMYFTHTQMLLWKWNVVKDKSWGERFSLPSFIWHLRCGILDKSIPFCCILYFCFHWFLTGANQVRERGILLIRDYYKQNLGTGFVPCPVHQRLLLECIK